MSLGFEFDPGLNSRWRGAVEDHKSHAKSEWPREACGVVRGDGSYLATPNVAEDPLVSFRIPDGVFEAEEPLAVLHSHPSRRREDGSYEAPMNCPSAADMESQADTGVPWGISLVVAEGATDPFWFGEGVPRPPLLGRMFRHGVTDCYSAVRDWHSEIAEISIPDFPRDDDWWTGGGDGAEAPDMYIENFKRAGFRRVDRDAGSILTGDVFLCKIRSKVYNHGGVYVGDGLIFHHLTHRLSRRDPAAPWRDKLSFLVRHQDLPDDWNPEKTL